MKRILFLLATLFLWSCNISKYNTKHTINTLLSHGIIQLNDSIAIDANEVGLGDFYSAKLDSGIYINSRVTDAISPFFSIGEGIASYNTEGKAIGILQYPSYAPFVWNNPVSNIKYDYACAYCDYIGKMLSEDKALKQQNVSIKGDLPSIKDLSLIPQDIESTTIISSDFFSKYSYKYTDSCLANALKNRPYYRTDSILLKEKMDIIFGNINGFIYLEYFAKPQRKKYLVYALPGKKSKKIQNLSGNLSEMAKEHGITYGGSFLNTKTHCNKNTIGYYDKPHYSIGFRCIYRIKKVN